MDIKVIFAVTVGLALAVCEESQLTNPDVNDLPNVQLHFQDSHIHHNRNKRKIIDYRNVPAKKWPRNIEIFFDDSLPTAYKDLIRGVIKDDFEANTCLRFTEIESVDAAAHQFMLFTLNSDPDLCKAYIGRNNDTQTFNGQPLYLGAKCFNYRGTLIHMIAATLGMYNEVQRPDRDDYVDIQWANIEQKGREYFVKQSEDLLTYHGTPYDYGSAVHYSADAWIISSLKAFSPYPSLSDSTSYTIRPKNPRLFRLLGQKSELSYYDIEVLNRAYCDDTDICDAPIVCSHGGYQDPNNCTKCKCPDGFAGDTCDSFAENVGDPTHQCTPLSNTVQVTDTETCVSSPGFEKNMSYTTGDKCTWILEAPEGTAIKMWLHETQFALPYSSKAYSFCLHWVEIKYQGIDTPRGPRFCSLDTILSEQGTFPNKFSPLTSESNKVMVIFKSPQAHLQTGYLPAARVGFKLCFQTGDMSTTTQTPTTTTEDLGPGEIKGGAVSKEQTSGSKSNHTGLIVGVICALLLLVIVFGVIIIVLLLRKKKKQVTPPPTPAVVAMANPGYANGAQAPAVAFNIQEPEDKKLAIMLEYGGVSMGDLPPKYTPTEEDSAPEYSVPYSASPVSSEPIEAPKPVNEYGDKDVLTTDADSSEKQSPEPVEPVYENTSGVGVKNLKSMFEN